MQRRGSIPVQGAGKRWVFLFSGQSMGIVSFYTAADKHLQFALFNCYFKYFPLRIGNANHPLYLGISKSNVKASHIVK